MVGVDGAMFDYLVYWQSNLIEGQDTNYLVAISLRERMSITLNYLVQGTYYRLPRNSFRVSVASVSKIVAEKCTTIIEVFKLKVMAAFSTELE